MSGGRAEDEAHLAQRMRAGDEAALCDLLDLHEDAMRRRIGHLLPPDVRRRLSITDVLQETRLVAFEQRREFEWRGEGSFRAWILAVAENKARRAFQRHAGASGRSVRREVTRARRPETQQFVGHEPSPSEHAMGTELAALARAALAELPADYREILRLTREEELSLRQAAARGGRSYEATKKLYGRALTRFTEAFDRLRGRSRD